MPVTVTSATTGNLAYSITAAALQSALEGLSTIGVGNVSVTKTSISGTNTWLVAFQGALAGVDVPLLRVNAAGLNSTASIDEATPGAPGVNEVQRLVSSATAGTFTLTALAVAAVPTEIAMAFKWIDMTLRADSVIAALVGTNVYGDAPPSPPALCVTYGLQLGTDNNALGGERINVLATVAIQGVARSAAYNSEVVALARRIDELFGMQANVILTDGTVASVERTAPLAYTEVVSGSQYRHSGGIYEVVIQQ